MLNGMPQEILDSVIDRMRNIFDRCAALPINLSITVSSPEVSSEQCDRLNQQLEIGIAEACPKMLSQFLAGGIMTEIARMETNLYLLRKAVGE